MQLLSTAKRQKESTSYMS
jgi:hypothetical protein